MTCSPQARPYASWPSTVTGNDPPHPTKPLGRMTIYAASAGSTGGSVPSMPCAHPPRRRGTAEATLVESKRAMTLIAPPSPLDTPTVQASVLLRETTTRRPRVERWSPRSRRPSRPPPPRRRPARSAGSRPGAYRKPSACARVDRRGHHATGGAALSHWRQRFPSMVQSLCSSARPRTRWPRPSRRSPRSRTRSPGPRLQAIGGDVPQPVSSRVPRRSPTSSSTELAEGTGPLQRSWRCWTCWCARLSCRLTNAVAITE